MIYIVVENGNPYPAAYSSFASAFAAVTETHAKDIEEQTMETADGTQITFETVLSEDTQSGKTYIYVEKDIHIYIYRLPIRTIEHAMPL